MHRTVKVGILDSKPAEVNGTKSKSLRYRHVKRACKQKKSRERKLPYSALNSFILVFSVTILRPLTCAKSYATIADRKSANSKGAMNGKNKFKESCARRQKRQPIPKRFSGDGSAPPRFLFGFSCCSCCLFRGVCLAAAPEREARRFVVRRQPHHNA